MFHLLLVSSEHYLIISPRLAACGMFGVVGVDGSYFGKCDVDPHPLGGASGRSLTGLASAVRISRLSRFCHMRNRQATAR